MSEHVTRTDEVARSLNRSHGSFELAFAPMLLALLGLWLDRTLGTVPLFTLVLALVGVLGVGTKLYYSYKNSMAALHEQGPWAGHTSSASFRAQTRARADHLSSPLEVTPRQRPEAPSPSAEALGRKASS